MEVSSSLVKLYDKNCKNPRCTKRFQHESRNKRYCCEECEVAGRGLARRRAKTRKEYKRTAPRRRAESMSRKQAREAAINDVVSWVCNTCGGVFRLRDLELHHRDGNPFNNDSDNWAFQCGACHPKSDTTWRKDKKEGKPIPDCRNYGCSVKSVKVKDDEGIG